MVKHDLNREKEVQFLVKEILRVVPEFIDYPNGPYTWQCPFCFEIKTGGYDRMLVGFRMEDIEHETNCAYLIAKGLEDKSILDLDN